MVMPEERGNAFLPDFSGPLSDVLTTARTPQPLQVPNPTAKVSKLAGAAAITDQLLAGIEKGRLRKFQNEQRTRQQQYEAIYRTFNQIQSDPRLTDSAKAQAGQEFRMALGGMIDKETSSADGKKGKGKDQPPVLGIIKQFAQGLTGGKMQGTPGIDVGSAIAKMSSVYDKTGQPLEKFSSQGQQTSLTKEIQDAIKQEGADSETSVRAVLARFQPKIQALLGPGVESQRFIDNFSRGAPGFTPEQEAANKRLNQGRQGQQGPPSQQSGDRIPPGLVTPVPQQGSQQKEGPPPMGGADQGVTPVGSQTKQRAFDWHSMNPGVYEISKTPQMVSYRDKGGKEQRAQALYVSNPDFSGYVNATTWEPLPSTAVDAAKSEQIDDREQKLNEQIRKNDEQIRNIESEMHNREVSQGLREQGLELKAADLARKQEEYDRTLEFRQQLMEQQRKISGMKDWRALYTNNSNRVAKIESEAFSASKALDAAGVSKDAKTSALNAIEKKKKERLNEAQGSYGQGLAEISKQSGLTFGTDGNPVEEGAQSAPPKAKTGGAKADKKLEKRGQEVSDFLK